MKIAYGLSLLMGGTSSIRTNNFPTVLTQLDTQTELQKSEGFEDMKRWKEKQEKLKKMNGKVSLPTVDNRDNQDVQLVVYMVPHSHDDMGWDKSVDEYYSGSNIEKQHASVKNIYDSVFEELPKDPKRRFCIAEMGYFSLWYY